MQHAKSNQTTKSSRQGRGDEKIGDSRSQLLTLVPIAQKDGHAAEEKSLEKSEQDTSDQEAGKGLDEAGAHADETPADGDDWQDAIEL